LKTPIRRQPIFGCYAMPLRARVTFADRPAASGLAPATGIGSEFSDQKMAGIAGYQIKA
jgi:hypothetical protein